MLFSVIIPCYNSQAFIEKACSSLEAQVYKRFEAIFIDDCSTDNTWDTLVFFQKKVTFDMIVIKNDNNRGPGITKYRGVQNSQGDYVVFMDSDDWYESNLLERLYGVLVENQSDIVFFDAFRVYANGKKTLIKNSTAFDRCSSIQDYVATAKGCLPYICSKRHLWNNLSMPSIYNAEDIAVIPILISRANYISILPEPLYNYFYRENSLSNTPGKNVYIAFLKSFEFTVNNIQKGFSEEVEFHGIKTILYGAVFNALRAGVRYSVIDVFVKDFATEYPQWRSNKYIKRMSRLKYYFLLLLDKRMYRLLAGYVFMHHFALKYLKL